MLFIAQKKGNRLLSDKKYWIDDFALYEFQEQFPDMDIVQFLSGQAVNDPGLQRFVQEVRRIKDEARDRPRHKRPAYSYEMIMERVNDGRRVPPSRILARDLTENDFGRLAENFLKETDPDKLLNLLRVFGCYPLPKGYQALLPMAKGEVQLDDPVKTVRFVGCACDALGQFRADEIRRFALDKLERGGNLSTTLAQSSQWTACFSWLAQRGLHGWQTFCNRFI